MKMPLVERRFSILCHPPTGPCFLLTSISPQAVFNVQSKKLQHIFNSIYIPPSSLLSSSGAADPMGILPSLCGVGRSLLAEPPAEPFLQLFLPKAPYAALTRLIQPGQSSERGPQRLCRGGPRAAPPVPAANPVLLFLHNALRSCSDVLQATSSLQCSSCSFQKSPSSLRGLWGKGRSLLESHQHGSSATHQSLPNNNAY